MSPIAHYLPYRATYRFQRVVADYIDRSEALADFYQFTPDARGVSDAIEMRGGYPVDRTTLVEVLNGQYRHLPRAEAVEQNIASLLGENTFTVCTAHQPNLATGYLYFVYKILHAIRLAAELNAQHPEQRFVPVYYMGSEDADLDELGTFRYGDKRFVWQTTQQGAVGRMNTESLKPLLDGLFSILGPAGANREELVRILQNAYLGHDTIARATHALVHALFGRYGLVVLDADDARLKRAFIPVMKKELLDQSSESLVRRSMADLELAGYKPQAHPRAINLFYLKDDLRARIERTTGDHWQVVDTGISWNKQSLCEELQAHPERFSPNVILRPLYQETILPNVAFIGGGAEVSYWLQLRSLFAERRVFYPVILLRQSVMWMNAAAVRLRQKTGFDIDQLFHSPDEAARLYIAQRSPDSINMTAERSALQQIFASIHTKAITADPTLEPSAGAALRRMERQIDVLETKMLRAEKRRHATGLDQLQRLQSALFPGGGLGERTENFMPYYLQYGSAFFEILLNAMEPMRGEFLVMDEQGG